MTYVIITFLFILGAWYVCETYEMHSQNHDSPEVVIDEVVGYLVAMLWMPMTWQAFTYTFVLFRALDMIKPPPISWIDKNVRGGYGVMLDDLVAGIVTNLVFQFVYTQTNWLGVRWGI